MSHPDTSTQAYQQVRQTNQDTSLRQRVAQTLRDEPLTTNELVNRIPEHSANAIRPRVNELIRMGCVKRKGKRTNPSGHAAYVNHLTTAGERYLAGDIDPDPGPSPAQLKTQTIEAARRYLKGEIDRSAVALKLMQYDEMRRRLDPEGDG